MSWHGMSTKPPRITANSRATDPFAPVPYRGGDGRYHFLYVTRDVETLEWYGGRHSTKNLHDGYVGSGDWPQLMQKVAPEKLDTRPTEFFPDVASAKRAEAEWITLETIAADLLCRNVQEGGHGLTSASARALHARPGHTASMAVKIKAAYARPGGKDRILAHLRRLAQDADAQARRLAALRTAAADPASLARRSITSLEVNARPEVQAKRSRSLKIRFDDPGHRARMKKTADDRWARDGEQERQGAKTAARHHRTRAERHGIDPGDVEAVDAAHAAHKAELNRKRCAAFRERHQGEALKTSNREKMARWRARMKAARADAARQ
jgi:hypothetical protein